MARCLISFGANLGDPRATIEQAQEKLIRATHSHAWSSSRFYNTPPVGGPVGQPPFLNRVMTLETEQSPWEVWRSVRDVETELGRERFRRWEARRIDVDILLFDDQRIWTPQLKIPHPRLCMRRFILEPAAEVASEWRDPVSRETIGALAARLRGGRANLVLCGQVSDRPIWLLEQVARQAAANWETLRSSEVNINQDNGQAAPRKPHAPGRWVAAVECLALKDQQPPIHIDPPPKLLVFYAADDAAARGGQWEDSHRQLAGRLNLVQIATGTEREPASQVSISEQPLCPQGARYLLATDDPQWAVHELVAALDAMDCPVEPLEDFS